MRTVLLITALAVTGCVQEAPELPDAAIEVADARLDAQPLDAQPLDALNGTDARVCTTVIDVAEPNAELQIDVCMPAIGACEWDYFRYWIGEQCVTVHCPANEGTPFETRCVCGTMTVPDYPPGNCDWLRPDAGS